MIGKSSITLRLLLIIATMLAMDQLCIGDVTYEFEATVSYIANDVGTGIQTNDLITGYFGMTDSTDSNPDGNLGTYANSGFVIYVNVHGGFISCSKKGQVQVQNGEESPPYKNDTLLIVTSEFSSSFTGILALANASMGVYLVDTNKAVFTSDDMPANISLADFQIANFGFSQPDTNKFGLVGHISMIRRVPEPVFITSIEQEATAGTFRITASTFTTGSVYQAEQATNLFFDSWTNVTSFTQNNPTSILTVVSSNEPCLLFRILGQ